jgi:fucose permease
LPRGSLLLLGLMGFGILMTEGAMADWTAVYLRNDLGLDAALAGAGFAVFSLAMAAGRLTGDRLVAATGPAVLVRGGATLAAFGLAGALVFHDPLAALIGFGCVGLGLANIVPILFSAAGRTPGVEPGTAIAAVTTSGYCGFLAGPPLVGFAADQIGLPAALGLLVGFMVLAALAGGVVRR